MTDEAGAGMAEETPAEKFVKLCDLSRLGDGDALAVELVHTARRFNIIVLRRGGDVFAFFNRCPHKGTPLETFPNQFFDAERRYLVCSTHGALFRPEDGYCVAGPCAGAFLEPVELHIRAGGVYLRTDRLEQAGMRGQRSRL